MFGYEKILFDSGSKEQYHIDHGLSLDEICQWESVPAGDIEDGVYHTESGWVQEQLPEFWEAFCIVMAAHQWEIPYERGYVYALRGVGTEFLKIGKSKNPDRRITELKTQMPFKVSVEGIFPSAFMSMAEKMLHKRFADRRQNGEWFVMPKKTAIYWGCSDKARFIFDPFTQLILQQPCISVATHRKLWSYTEYRKLYADVTDIGSGINLIQSLVFHLHQFSEVRF